MRTPVVGFAAALATGGILLAQVPPADNIPNWSTPATWSPARASGGITTMNDLPVALPFISITPCRIADTRAINGFSGQAGGPVLTSFNTRVFQITGSPGGVPAPPNGCAAGTIPVETDAVSIQITVVTPSSAGNLLAWDGMGLPTISVLNWDAGITALGNGLIVPLTVAGGLSVRLNTALVGQSTHVVIDVNGYFSERAQPNAPFRLSYSRVGGELMYLSNQSTTCPGGLAGCALAAEASGTGNAIFAQSGTTGATYGVVAYTNSTAVDSAGVRGEGAASTCGQPGVRTGILGAGGANATSEVPVVGIGDYEGVRGINTAGCTSTVASLGSLGWDDDTAVYGEGGNLVITGMKFFIDPHPTDASKVISYVSLEGPEAGTYFRGKGRFQNGIAVIEPPESFRLVTATEGLSIQVTPIGQMASVAVASIGLDRIVVRGSRNVEFFYTVNGVRATFPDFQPIRENKFFVPHAKDWTLPTGLSAEQRRRLIQNGAFLENGKVNPETAKALGWDESGSGKEWHESAPTDGARQDKRASN